MYALCSYILGYYWNIIWMDTVALLPLVVLGLVYLVRDGKYRLYVVALGLSLFTNFYIGMFTCIFAVIAYVCLCVFYLKPAQLPGRTIAMLLGSLLGGALAAIVLLPAYYALQLTYSVNNIFPTTVQFYESWRTLAADLISFHEPTAKDGLPNLACGVLSLALMGPFLRSAAIRIREKVGAILVLAFLLISCNCNVLNYIWHGFHFPNMLPISFFVLVLLCAADCRLPCLSCGIGRKVQGLGHSGDAGYGCAGICRLLQCAGKPGGVLVCSSHAPVCCDPAAVFPGDFRKKLLYLSLSIVLAFEMFQNVKLGTETVSTSDYLSYPTQHEEVESLLAQIREQDDSLFYRTELSSWYTLNDPALYGYHGLSQFSSTANESVTKWMRAIGVPASEAGNRYYYGGGTPVSNAFSGIRYLISRSGSVLDLQEWQQLASEGACYSYQNQYDLPVGFWTAASLQDYAAAPDGNPFDNQNTLFRLATGVETPLFTRMEVDSVLYEGADATKNGYGSYTYQADAGAETRKLQYNYKLPVDGTLYGYMSLPNGSSISVLRNDSFAGSYNNGNQGYIFPMGTFSGSETASVSVSLPADSVTGTAMVYVYQLNLAALEEGYAKLQSGGIQITEFTDTKLSGSLTASQDGLCYFSIPYEEGWQAEVDGVKTAITPIGNAMIAVPVTAGTHTISLHYCPKGFAAGACATTGAVLLLIVLAVIEHKRGKPFLQPVAVQQTVKEITHNDAEDTET